MTWFYEYDNSISRKTISFFCQKADHGCLWIGKHIIVVYSACSCHPGQPKLNQVIIGTNTGLFDHLRKSCRETAGARYLQKLPTHSWCANIYRKADKRERLGAEGILGGVRSRYHVTISPGSSRKLQGSFRNPLHGNNVVLVGVPRKQQPSILLKSFITEVGTSINKISQSKSPSFLTLTSVFLLVRSRSYHSRQHLSLWEQRSASCDVCYNPSYYWRTISSINCKWHLFSF